MTEQLITSSHNTDRVAVGPFRVNDVGRDDLVRTVVDGWAGAPRDRAWTVFALHVGGLNHRRNYEFVRVMNAADIVYADGGSVVALARMAGARRIERAPTTDVGWELLEALRDKLGRPLRLALIGGAPSLAARAAEVFRDRGVGAAVVVEHGYHTEWSDVIAALGSAEPDVCIVGLGAPWEMLWASQWAPKLPPTLVLTCGGWFGHMLGDERRAPRIIRRAGLEWMARVAQAPRRLGPRYAAGLWSTIVLAKPALCQRLLHRRRHADLRRDTRRGVGAA